MDVLAELEPVQQSDEPGPHGNGQNQREGHGEGSPERDVAEDVERAEIGAERNEQIIEHGLPQRP